MSHAVKLPTCPNCGTDLQQKPNNFCPECGQPNHDVNVTFGHIVEETLEGVFHFDSKVWLTFRELLLKPGKLTVDFLEGRRARFVPPIRLYIFLSVVFFFLLGKQGASIEQAGDAAQEKQKTAATRQAEDKVLVQNFGIKIKRSEPQPDDLVIGYDGGEGATFNFTRTDVANRPLMTRLASGDARVIDSMLVAQKARPNWWLRLLAKRFARLQVASEEEKEHSTLRNLSVGMFLLMPLFALLLKGFYRRQRPLYVQHLIFSVHLHCFFFLLASLAILIDFVLPRAWNPGPVSMVLAWAYWVLALRRYSGQGLGRTIWKSALLFGGYVLMLTAFMLGVAAVTLAMF